MTEDFELRTSPDTFLALRCLVCGSVFLGLVPADEAIARTYTAGYFAGRSSPWKNRPAQEARALDLGPWVAPDQLSRLAQAGPQYDLVRLDLTLECAADPLATLQAVRAALRPNGRAFVLLNNLRSPAFGWFGGRHWGGYDSPRQRRVLSSDGLARLAWAAGLEVVESAGLPAGEPWVRSFHRLCTDWAAPSWLTGRFSPRARLSRAGFRLVEAALRPAGRSAFVVASLRQPGQGAS